MQRAGIALLASALIALTGLWLATAFIADVFSHQRALGAPIVARAFEVLASMIASVSTYGAAFHRW